MKEEVEWRRHLAWLNCRDEQGVRCVSLWKDNPNLRVRVLMTGRHQPKYGRTRQERE